MSILDKTISIKIMGVVVAAAVALSLSTYLIMDSKLDTLNSKLATAENTSKTWEGKYNTCTASNTGLRATIESTSNRSQDNADAYKNQLDARDKKMTSVSNQLKASQKKYDELLTEFKNSNGSCEDSIEWLKNQSYSLQF